MKNKAFTLIEVLVVVAIIALLISILIPSLAAAKSNGRSAVCLSNLHQIGLAMNIFASGHNGKVPVGADPDDIEHWVSIVAREILLVKRLRSNMCVNHIRVDQIELYQCPERTATGSKPFLGYVSNSMNPDGPLNNDWRPLDGIVSIANRYKMPANIVYVACGETESKMWHGKHPALGYLSPLGARENWEYVVRAGMLDTGREQELISYLINNGGGLDCMDVWRGAQLPQYLATPNPTRRVALDLHMKKFTNAVFYDGHADKIRKENRESSIENHKAWLRRFGLTEAGITAAFAIP